MLLSHSLFTRSSPLPIHYTRHFAAARPTAMGRERQDAWRLVPSSHLLHPKGPTALRRTRGYNVLQSTLHYRSSAATVRFHSRWLHTLCSSYFWNRKYWPPGEYWVTRVTLPSPQDCPTREQECVAQRDVNDQSTVCQGGNSHPKF